MNEIIKNLLRNFTNASQSLKKKSLFLDKPWVYMLEDGSTQKFIFKSNNQLIMSINGSASIGSWDYLPEANSLLMNMGIEVWLLKEQYIDENVMILKKDGYNDDYFSLANENSVPDFDAVGYLHKKRAASLNIREYKLLNGLRMQITDGYSVSGTNNGFTNHNVDFLDENYNFVNVSDGKYITRDKKHTFYVKNKIIEKSSDNQIIQLEDKRTIEIEFEILYAGNRPIGKTISMDGKDVTDKKLRTENDRLLYIQDSKIIKVTCLRKYTTQEGYVLLIEQAVEGSILKGDRIFECSPMSMLADGKYKLKNFLWKSIVVKGLVVQ